MMRSKAATPSAGAIASASKVSSAAVLVRARGSARASGDVRRAPGSRPDGEARDLHQHRAFAVASVASKWASEGSSLGRSARG